MKINRPINNFHIHLAILGEILHEDKNVKINKNVTLGELCLDL